MNTGKHSEKGQALVLIILSIVVIFGFAALAVDMGRVYSERRRAQNAADAAALAAAQAVTANQDFWQAGMDSAVLNGFDNDESSNWVTVVNPPESGPYGPDSGLPEYVRREYYQVTISQNVAPVFSQFIFPGQEAVTVEAVSRATYLTGVSSGNAIHALATDSDALRFDGTVGVRVEGGNIVSNGGGLKDGGSGKVFVELGEILITDDWTCNGCDAETVLPAPQTGVTRQMVEAVPAPYCPTADEYDADEDVNYYYHPAGVGAGTLEPGVHCIEGGITLTGHDHLYGKNVFIVLLSGGIFVKGGATLDLSHDRDLIDSNGNQWGGMLLYAPPANTSTLTLGGNTGSLFQGTILAPSAHCDMGGTPLAQANHTALICNTVNFHGTTDVTIVYRQAELYRFPARIDLSQ